MGVPVDVRQVDITSNPQKALGESPLQVLSCFQISLVYSRLLLGGLYMALIVRVLFPEILNDSDTSSVGVLWTISVTGIE